MGKVDRSAAQDGRFEGGQPGAETSGVVSDVLAARHDVHLEDAAPLFAGVPDLRADEMTLPGTVQLWPHRQGTDAMFLALLRKE